MGAIIGQLCVLPRCSDSRVGLASTQMETSAGLTALIPQQRQALQLLLDINQSQFSNSYFQSKMIIKISVYIPLPQLRLTIHKVSTVVDRDMVISFLSPHSTPSLIPNPSHIYDPCSVVV